MPKHGKRNCIKIVITVCLNIETRTVIQREITALLIIESKEKNREEI
jgi:hypothetical protein